MSDQAAPAPGQEDPQAAADGAAGADPYKIHDHAVRASKELEAIATALAHANAPEKTTASFTKMAEACRSLGSAMSRAPAPAPKPSDRTGESLDGAAAGYAQSAAR